MGRPKKIIKVKEPVRIRERKLANGNISLYFDIYERGVRKVESPGLYIVPGNDPLTKIQNEQTRAVAEQMKAQRILALQQHGLKNWEKIRRSGTTLLDWLQKYIEDDFGVSDSTIRNRRSLKGRVQDFLQSANKQTILLANVDEDFCREFLTYLATATRRNAKKVGGTINNGAAIGMQTLFTSALNRAVKEGLISNNPMLRLERREKFKRKESTIEYLTIDEIRRIMEADIVNKEVKRAFLFSCFSGLRLSDVRSLTWRKIQMSPDGKTRFVNIEMQKTKDPIVLPLSQEALKWLNPKEDLDELIFDLPSPSNIESNISGWMDNAGIEKHITYHCSRHTFATMMLTLGVDIYTVSKLLGHRKIETTQIYAKIMGHAEKSVAGLPKKSPCSDTESNNRMYLCTWKINQQYMNQ